MSSLSFRKLVVLLGIAFIARPALPADSAAFERFCKWSHVPYLEWKHVGCRMLGPRDPRCCQPDEGDSRIQRAIRDPPVQWNSI